MIEEIHVEFCYLFHHQRYFDRETSLLKLSTAGVNSFRCFNSWKVHCNRVMHKDAAIVIERKREPRWILIIPTFTSSDFLSHQ